MKLSIQMYKAIAVASLMILFYVQYRLIYNTYELKDRQYLLKEKSLIKEAYAAEIRNDKVFPGGQRIIDHYINRNMLRLETLYKTNPAKFDREKQLICDSVFMDLIAYSNVDSLFSTIVLKNELEEGLKHLLVVEGIGITFDGKEYVSLYNGGSLSTVKNEPIGKGIVISGDLSNPNEQNLIMAITVSAADPYSNRVSFTLYVDQDSRSLAIVRQMLPTLALSVLSISFVVGIFLITYSNWLRQKKLSDMKSDFLNSITHEFNTPLSTIMVANKSLQNEEIIADRARIRPLTEVIQRQSNRLQILIGQALDITSLHRETVDKERHQLNPLLEEIIHDYKLKHEGKVNVVFECDEQVVYIELNRFSFTTMFYNIFDNSVKYNLSQEKEISVVARKEAEVISISVSDNGIGMPRKMTMKIFEKFYRGEHDNIRASGLGLGLFYVKECLEAHGWKLYVQSEEGKGSTFIISIPKQ